MSLRLVILKSSAIESWMQTNEEAQMAVPGQFLSCTASYFPLALSCLCLAVVLETAPEFSCELIISDVLSSFDSRTGSIPTHHTFGSAYYVITFSYLGITYYYCKMIIENICELVFPELI